MILLIRANSYLFIILFLFIFKLNFECRIFQLLQSIFYFVHIMYILLVIASMFSFSVNDCSPKVSETEDELSVLLSFIYLVLIFMNMNVQNIKW